MQAPVYRHFLHVSLFAAAALLAACSGSDNPEPSALSNVQPGQKAACGGAAPASASMNCPPAFASSSS